jgi:hypothetical protein
MRLPWQVSTSSRIDAIDRDHLEAVECKLADLTALRRALKIVITSCDGDVVAGCRIIEVIGRQPHRNLSRGEHELSLARDTTLLR